MKPLPFNSWTIARLLSFEDTDRPLEAVSPAFLRVVAHLASRPLDARREVWDGFLCHLDAPDEIITALAGVDPTGPPPEIDVIRGCATLADVRRLVAESQWLWKGWLASGVLNGLAADPGTGKTLMPVSLALVLWLGMLWPDGQENPTPRGAQTLWVAGDRHFAQLIGLAESYRLPDEAMLFNTPADEPTSGLDLDDGDELSRLEENIRGESPGLVIIDTVGMTTDKNLCKPEDARGYFGPLMDLAQRTGVPFLLLTHLSKDGQALGRRFNGACRLVWKMTAPDPEGQPDRRRVWVEKSYTEKPPALGMSIAQSGCHLDSNPPNASEPSKGGRPPEDREKAKQFILNALGTLNDQIGNTLKGEWEKDGESGKTFWRAVDELKDSGSLATDGGPGTCKQVVLHLNSTGPDPDAEASE